MSTVTNRYLAGNFAPVRDELTAFDLPVEGALPPELSGRLLRIGPNPVKPPEDPTTYHWFTGDGMVHAVEIRDGRAVSYRNRWVRTDRACDALGEAPPPGQPADVFPTGSVANTNIVAHAGRLLALVEVSLPTEVTPELETIARCDYGGRLRSPMTAHPKLDPVTGELLFFGYDIFGPPWLRYHVVDATGHLVRTEPIDIEGPAMVHDFAVTERHVVFFDLPVVFDVAKYLGQRPFPAGWEPEYGARVGVMPRDGGNADVRWFDIEPCYVFHPLNAYDAGDDVVVDVVRYERMFDTDVNGPAETQPTLDRWTVDLSAGKVTEARLDDRGQEFPRVDDRRVGRRHRYGYATSLDVDNLTGWSQGGLLKHDLARGTTDVHDLGPGRTASEGVFAPAGPGEDDGYVLATVYDAARDGSDLVVLDASDFTAPPVATVRLPQRVPFGFHGNWVPDDAVPATP